MGNEVRFSFTSGGKMVSCTDAGGARSEYRYDLKDQVLEIWRHGVVRETYDRDAAGNLVAKYASGGEELLRLEIGPANLPAKCTLASGDEHVFEHAAFGRYVLAGTRDDANRFEYDLNGNRIADKRNGKGSAHVFRGWCRIAKSIFLDRFVTTREQLPDGTLVVTDPGGNKHEILFHPHGVTERRLSSGCRETSQYDNVGRCLFKCAQFRSGRTWSRRYHWSGEGELSLVEDSAQGEIQHEYDAAHRLRRRIVGGLAEDYRVDAADNRKNVYFLAGDINEFLANLREDI